MWSPEKGGCLRSEGPSCRQQLAFAGGDLILIRGQPGWLRARAGRASMSSKSQIEHVYKVVSCVCCFLCLWFAYVVVCCLCCYVCVCCLVCVCVFVLVCYVACLYYCMFRMLFKHISISMQLLSRMKGAWVDRCCIKAPSPSVPSGPLSAISSEGKAV